MGSFNIIIAARLKDNPVTRFLDELGTTIKFLALRRGEFVLAGKIGVRYFTRTAFIQAVKDRTIYREVIELKREYPEPIIVVEGDHGQEIAPDVTTMQSALIFVSVTNRIPILTTGNEDETAQLLFMLTAQSESAAGQTVVSSTGESGGHVSEKKETALDPVRQIIQSLPEVGPALAESLLNHFGSLARLFAADAGELRQVEGIGPKRAKRIYDFMHQADVGVGLS
jgi:Fanconi anemia group M protein